MGKFFNHYKSDRAVGFAHPFNERSAESWHYTLGYRGYDWTWSATSRYGWSGFIRDARNCRSFAAATFKATIKRKRCSKQNAELTLYFWFRRQFFRMLVGMRTHHRIVSAYGTKGLTRMVTWRQARFVRTICWESLLLALSGRANRTS
jgi:hypothetical protein